MDEIRKYAEALRGITEDPYDHSFYKNEYGQWGYKATYRVGNDWYWYSVSGVTVQVTPSEVADAITNGDRPTRCNVVKLNGLEATLYSDDHWYMLNRGSERP
jgi:hypothetical protein